jgi:hypothetical protein
MLSPSILVDRLFAPALFILIGRFVFDVEVWFKLAKPPGLGTGKRCQRTLHDPLFKLIKPPRAGLASNGRHFAVWIAGSKGIPMQHPTWKFSGDWSEARKFLAVADGRITATGTVGQCGELSAPATGVHLSSSDLQSSGLNFDKSTHHV